MMERLSSRGLNWLAMQASRNRRNRLAVLYFILGDLVLLLFMGMGLPDGIEVWLAINAVVVIAYLFVRSALLWDNW